MPEFVTDLTGGGNLTVWLVVGGVVALWIAYKAVKLVMKLVSLAVGATLLLGTAPWAGTQVAAPEDVVACVVRAVEEAASGWQTNLTKRVTVEELSADAACSGDTGLANGTAVARLRTFYDVPFETWDVDPSGATTRLRLPSATGR